MDAKIYMMQLGRIKAMIKNKLDRIAEFQEMSVNIKGCWPDGMRVQMSKDVYKMERFSDKKIDLEESLKRDVARLLEKQNEIMHTIEELDLRDYEILFMRYFEGYSSEDIASCYDRCISWANTAQRKALKHLQELLDSRENIREIDLKNG